MEIYEVIISDWYDSQKVYYVKSKDEIVSLFRLLIDNKDYRIDSWKKVDVHTAESLVNTYLTELA